MGVSIVCSIVCFGTDQRKHQSSTSMAFVWGIHQRSVDSPHKGPVTHNMFPINDVIMGWCCLMRRGTVTWRKGYHGSSSLYLWNLATWIYLFIFWPDEVIFCHFLPLGWRTNDAAKWPDRQAGILIVPTSLTHLPLDKMADILADDKFGCIFLNENDTIPIRISLKFVPRSPVDNEPAFCSGNGLARNRRQAITLNNADPVHWHAYMRHQGEMSYTTSWLKCFWNLAMLLTPTCA